MIKDTSFFFVSMSISIAKEFSVKDFLVKRRSLVKEFSKGFFVKRFSIKINKKDFFRVRDSLKKTIFY